MSDTVNSRKGRRWPLLPVLLLLLVASNASAQTAPAASLALLPIANRSADPRYDYLEGLIQGVLQFDLASIEGIQVVERDHLESVLKEQELRLSGLSEDAGEILQVGKLLGADYLLRGEYVALGSEVQLTLSLIEVATARTSAFNERGRSENLIHALAERIAQKLTGKSVALQSPQRDRSILSLKDETPGVIALHSHLIDAEIFLDGEFAGFTTGDERVPFEIAGLRPGPHILRLHLSRFGVVKQPEITFHDWEERVEVQPGKRHVVRAQAYHFNETIYKLQQLLREELRLDDSGRPVSREHDASFIDRQGKKVPIRLTVSGVLQGGEIRAEAALAYEGRTERFNLVSRDKDEELEQEIGKVQLKLEIDRDWKRVSYSLWRTDIHQNMDMD